MKINTLIIALVFVLLIAPLAVVKAAVAKKNATPKLVFDLAAEEETVAKKFRADNTLNVSASGQFSATELNNILNNIALARNKIWIIDLRLESHGFINGVPVSWYANKNQANLHKAPDEIGLQENQLLEEIAAKPEIIVYTVKKLPDGEIAADKPTNIIPQQTATEQQLVASLGANYKRFHVLDHHKPDDYEVDILVDFIKNDLQPGDWLHFHCRGGKGRSSTFIAMYDMIRNSNTVSFADIMQRQIDMGNTRLDKTTNKPEKSWKIGASQQRYTFLQKFYTYVRDPNGYAQRSWSAWLHHYAAKK